MMRKLVLSVIIVLTFPAGYAQPPDLGDPDWYIDYIVLDGITHESPITAMGGFINPNLVFEVNMAYGIVDPESDSFFAMVSYDPVNPEFTFTEPAITLPGCQAYCQFAIVYFELLAGDYIEVNFSYEIVDNGNDTQRLTIIRADGNIAVFNDFPPLGIDDLALTRVSVYPNPVSNDLFISSEITIESISVFSISGKKVMEQKNIDNSIDVSALPQGMYFLELISENGKAVQKFIKQ
jgi:Secretion system C-terminal sorting domain